MSLSAVTSRPFEAPSPIDLAPRSLSARLDTALQTGEQARLDSLSHAEPRSERDALQSMLCLHDLWISPVSELDGREAFHGHPVIASLKWRLEHDFVSRLDDMIAGDELVVDVVPAVEAMRRVAARELIPPVYEWLRDHATWNELVNFLAIEGGPDGGFDDFVALTQVGIRGIAKVALASNYWDELGRGTLSDVHTVLHDDLVNATGMRKIPRADLPTSALERAAIGGVLATNRWLQPEAIGAFGLLELQAGPRCRAVVRALHRLKAPAGAFPFYEEHATADPLHGKDWLDRVVAPLAEADWRWSARMTRGALWRSAINHRFFVDASQRRVRSSHPLQ